MKDSNVVVAPGGFKGLWVGCIVKRISNGHTNGRIGTVLEVSEFRPRARVAWAKEADGQPIKIRTWVAYAELLTAEGVAL